MKNLIKVSVFSLVFLSFFAHSMQSKPEIVYAWYGSDGQQYMPNNEKTANQVVNKLRSIVDKYGFITIPAAQHKFYGFDPLPNVKKTTAIHVRYNGKEQHLRAAEGTDFVYPTNTDKNLAQKAFQEIKATLTTAAEPIKETPITPSAQPASQQPGGQPSASPSPTSHSNLFPDICLPRNFKKDQKNKQIEDSGVVFYFVKSDNDFKGVPLEKKVCSVISDYMPPLTAVEDQFEKRSTRTIREMNNFSFIVWFPDAIKIAKDKGRISTWGYEGLFSELCPDAIIQAQTMINSIKEPNKTTLDLNKHKGGGIVIQKGFRSPKDYDQLGEVIGVIINKFSFPGNCSSGPLYYAITPVPAPTNPFFKIVQAIYAGNLAELKHIVESESIDVNQPLAWNQTTPFVEAIRSKQTEIAHYLITKGATVTEDNEKLIISANMYKQLAPLIIELAKKPISKVLLEEMVKQNDNALIQLALQKKLVEPKVVIELATKYNNYELVNLASQTAITNNKESK